MLAQVVRSGVVEACHDGAVAVVAPDGSLLASDGEIDRPFLIRSSAKPFQAMAALEAGARFAPEQLALACASHGGEPIHIAYVESMLAEVGLDESHLQCPPDWPISQRAANRLIAAGQRTRRRLWHNCSGKHAGMLRACVAAGWPVETYLDPGHPLQVLAKAELSAAVDAELGAAGVDGCGAPVFQVTTRQLARGYATLATDLRYHPIRAAMSRFGALTAHSPLMSAPSRHWGHAAKGGAEGCFGIAIRDRFGVALKSFDGNSRPLGPATLSALTQVGVVPDLTRGGSGKDFEVAMFGGGRVVGAVESLVDLK